MKKYALGAIILFCLVIAAWIQRSRPTAKQAPPPIADMATEKRGPATHAANAVSPPSPETVTAESKDTAPRDIARLNAASAQAWTARRSGFKDQIRTLTGGRWLQERAGSPADKATSFINDFALELFAVPPEQLKLKEISRTDRTKVTYQQEIQGWPVYGATLNLFFEDGELTRVQSDLEAAEGRVKPLPILASMDQIFDAYKSSGQELKKGSELSLGASARTVLYPSAQELTPAYEFSVRLADGRTQRVVYDPEARRVIKQWETQIR